MEINELLQGLFITILTGVIGVVGAYARLALKRVEAKADAEISKIQNEDTRKLIDATFDRVQDLATNAVVSAETTLVDSIKKSNEDGKLTKEDGEYVLAQVKERVISQLGVQGKELLGNTITDVDAYIEDLIHKSLAEITGKI